MKEEENSKRLSYRGPSRGITNCRDSGLLEQCDAPKSRIGRFLMVSFLAATSVNRGVLSENMKTAPTQIDGAEVVALVILDPKIHMDSGSLRLYADDVLQTSFYGLAIATYDLSAFYLFFSDIDWETENDTLHDSVAEAMETAERKFGVTPSQWNFYIEELKPA